MQYKFKKHICHIATTNEIVVYLQSFDISKKTAVRFRSRFQSYLCRRNMDMNYLKPLGVSHGFCDQKIGCIINGDVVSKSTGFRCLGSEIRFLRSFWPPNLWWFFSPFLFSTPPGHPFLMIIPRSRYNRYISGISMGWFLHILASILILTRIEKSIFSWISTCPESTNF